MWKPISKISGRLMYDEKRDVTLVLEPNLDQTHNLNFLIIKSFGNS
jgi:hypothetical protein